ncbi:MAG: PIN domain-containing protein [Chloroflexota bacterium]
MGKIEDLIGQRVYYDTNIFVYIIEGFKEYESLLNSLFAMMENEEMTVITSELSLAEALVYPIANNIHADQELYKGLFSQDSPVEVYPVTRQILIQSAEHRALVGDKLPDAIHMATALLSGCQYIISNDTGLKPPSGLPVYTLSDLSVE